jgi:hypothetical protein
MSADQGCTPADNVLLLCCPPGTPQNVDLGDLLRWLAAGADAELSPVVTNARTVYKSSVVKFRRDAELNVATGVAIYFPLQVSSHHKQQPVHGT